LGKCGGGGGLALETPTLFETQMALS
jgi:hypothetical protein